MEKRLIVFLSCVKRENYLTKYLWVTEVMMLDHLFLHHCGVLKVKRLGTWRQCVRGSRSVGDVLDHKHGKCEQGAPLKCCNCGGGPSSVYRGCVAS